MDYRLRTLLAPSRVGVIVLFAAGISIVFGLHLSAALDTVIILAATGGAAVTLLASARLRERRWVALPLAGTATAWTFAWAFWQWNILATGLPPGPGSPADAFLIGYPLVALALLRLERRRSNTQGRALDVAILMVAAANLTWLYVVDPLVLDNTSLPIYARGIQCAYLLCNVLVFVGAARLATTSWPQPRSTVLLTLGAVSLLIADVPWNWLTLTGSYDGGGSLTDAGWPFSFVLLALGARELRLRGLRPARDEEPRVSPGHLALLGAAMVIVPASLAIQATLHAEIHTIVIGVVMMILVSSLVFFRLVKLLRDERRSLVREAQRVALLADNDELRSLDMLKDQFIATVSHELRTPLTSIRGYLELLLSETDLAEKHRKLLAIVDRNSDRLLRLVGDLLFVAQVDAGKLSLTLAPMTVDEIASDCVQSLKPVAADKGIELVLDLRPTPPVNADGARIAQVLDNLVGNAIKFTSSGKIELRLRPTNDSVLIEVADEGAGISPEDQTRLFNRFFRSAYAADQAVAGSGLGLAISKALVEAHGGTIGVESKSGVGSTFWVRLPYAAPLAAAA